MLLERYNTEEISAAIAEGAPMIVTKGNARRAFFKKSNRHYGAGTVPRRPVKSVRRGVSLRGNSFTGFFTGRCVVVKINPVKNRTKGVGVGAGSGAANLYHHVRYISRGGAGEEGEKAQLFNAQEEGMDGLEFFKSCQDDRHHFRMIISPENGHDIDNFRGYVRNIMEVVEKDLGTSLEWISAIHYDTDDIHAHVIIRGSNDRGEDLVIGRDYISRGIRGRAQEIATELLGERSLSEIQKAQEKEVDVMRVTSLDRFIEERMGKERVMDVRKENNFGKSGHYEKLIKGRLQHLQVSGLAMPSWRL